MLLQMINRDLELPLELVHSQTSLPYQYVAPHSVTATESGGAMVKSRVGKKNNV